MRIDQESWRAYSMKYFCPGGNPMKLSKQDFLLLERVWYREMMGTLPLQSKNRRYERLRDKGLVEFVTGWVVHKDRFGALTVDGWILTHRGRRLYCQRCSEEALE